MSVFTIELKVRDYELDAQGIVNNSVYQNYLEHARHEFLFSNGVDFAKLASNNVLLVVKTIELNFKSPLGSRDRFIVEVTAIKNGNLRVVFKQTIKRIHDNKIILNGLVTGVCLVNGRPVIPETIPEVEGFLSTIEA